MTVKIPTFEWKQVDGDMDPSDHGGTIARADGDSIEFIEIQPVLAYVGESEALEIGYPFWSNEGYFTASDLEPGARDVAAALDYCGITRNMVNPLTIALALFQYGHKEPGSHGWAADVLNVRAQWWGSKRPRGHRFLEDEDREFRALQRENR